MSRLAKRLRGYQPAYLQPQNTNQPEGYPVEQNPYQDYQQQPEYQQQPSLSQEYDLMQQRAREYERDMRAIEKTNPYTLRKEIVTDPTPKGVYEMTIFGRPVDLSMLENYVVHKISPKTIVTLLRYSNSKTMEEIKGYSKRPPMKIKGSIIWMIIGAGALLAVGIYFLTSGASLSDMMQGMFGGLGM